MSVQLRDATLADKTTCTRLLAELRTDSGTPSPSVDDQFFTELISQTRGRVLLAVEEDVVLGMATVSYNIALRFGGEYAQLEELIVNAAARGKRVGDLLMNAIIEQARERGCREIGLYLLPTTMHNQAFYERYGFETLGPEIRMGLG